MNYWVSCITITCELTHTMAASNLQIVVLWTCEYHQIHLPRECHQRRLATSAQINTSIDYEAHGEGRELDGQSMYHSLSLTSSLIPCLVLKPRYNISCKLQRLGPDSAAKFLLEVSCWIQIGQSNNNETACLNKIGCDVPDYSDQLFQEFLANEK